MWNDIGMRIRIIDKIKIICLDLFKLLGIHRHDTAQDETQTDDR